MDDNMLGHKVSSCSQYISSSSNNEVYATNISQTVEEKERRRDKGNNGDKYEIDIGFKNTYTKSSDVGKKIRDAAALCSVTYACDPNRAGKDVVYRTKTGTWVPYLPENYNQILSNYTVELFEQFNNCSSFMKSGTSRISLYQKVVFGRFKGDILNDFDKNFTRPRTGFFSMLYFLPICGGYKLAYVLAGTTMNGIAEQFCDWGLSNVPQALLGISPQYTLAIQNAKILNTICKEKGYELCFIGHSLGGGMALACALATDREAVVFNNAGLSYLRNIIHGSYWDNYRHKIIRVFTDQDLLSTEKQNKSLMNHINSVISHQKGITKTYNQDIEKLSDKEKLKMPGKSIYIGKGGHGIDGICRALELVVVGNKNQIKDGI